jgi:hypothetical protein
MQVCANCTSVVLGSLNVSGNGRFIIAVPCWTLPIVWGRLCLIYRTFRELTLLDFKLEGSYCTYTCFIVFIFRLMAIVSSQKGKGMMKVRHYYKNQSPIHSTRASFEVVSVKYSVPQWTVSGGMHVGRYIICWWQLNPNALSVTFGFFKLAVRKWFSYSEQLKHANTTGLQGS